jgi:hypothetical protein
MVACLAELNLDDLNISVKLQYFLHSIRTQIRFQDSLLLLTVVVSTLDMLQADGTLTDK